MIVNQLVGSERMPPPSNPLDRSTEITRIEGTTTPLEELGKLIRNLEKLAHKALARPDNLSIDTLRDGFSQFHYQFNRWAKVSFPDIDRFEVLTPPSPPLAAAWTSAAAGAQPSRLSEETTIS